MKNVHKGILGLIALFALSLIIVVGGILQGWYFFKPAKADCIIILGCKVNGSVPSPFLVSRIEEAIKLYRDGKSNYIIASGGQGANEDISEAEAIQRYLVDKGVPQSSIILEDQSTSTWQNLSYSKEKMQAKGFKNAIVVSNKFHLKRASMIARKLEIKASYSGAYNSEHKWDELGSFFREILATYKYFFTQG